MRIDELMTRDVVSVLPSATLREVASVLAERRISGVPVCDFEGHVLGVVSEADILVKEQGFSPREGGLLGRLLDKADAAGPRLAALTAGDAMTRPAVAVGPRATVTAAARLMLEHRINRLPVVEADRLVGIVSRSDLVRAFARTDDELAREIVEDVLVRMLWLSPDDVSVTVVDGEVTLAGAVASAVDAELAERYVRGVPGVVSVRSRLVSKEGARSRRARRGARLPARV